MKKETKRKIYDMVWSLKDDASNWKWYTESFYFTTKYNALFLVNKIVKIGE